MGFPMTVERVIARNGIDPKSTLADDIRRLAEDSVTLALKHTTDARHIVLGPRKEPTAENIRRQAEAMVAGLDMSKHPFTCDNCSWGRNPENFSEDAYIDHVNAEHGGHKSHYPCINSLECNHDA